MVHTPHTAPRLLRAYGSSGRRQHCREAALYSLCMIHSKAPANTSLTHLPSAVAPTQCSQCTAHDKVTSADLCWVGRAALASPQSDAIWGPDPKKLSALAQHTGGVTVLLCWITRGAATSTASSQSNDHVHEALLVRYCTHPETKSTHTHRWPVWTVLSTHPSCRSNSMTAPPPHCTHTHTLINMLSMATSGAALGNTPQKMA